MWWLFRQLQAVSTTLSVDINIPPSLPLCPSAPHSYHHFGEPKRWYAVPSPSAAGFEQTFRSTLPDQFAAQPDLLFHLVTMLSPRKLQEANVPCYSVRGPAVATCRDWALACTEDGQQPSSLLESPEMATCSDKGAEALGS